MNEELTRRLAEESANLQLRQFIPDDMMPEKFEVSMDMGSDFSLLETLGIKFDLYNPNSRIRTTDCYDCVQRAFCALLDKDWDTVYQDLFRIGFESGFMPNSINTITKYAKMHGFTTIDFEGGPSKIKLGSFLAKHKNGHIGISSCGHMFPYIDGVIYDTRFCMDFIEEIIGEEIRFIVCKPEELGYSDIIKEYNNRRLL